MAGVLFDLDGVFYVGNEPVPGAVDTLEWFRQRGIPYLFLTNTTSKSRAGLVDKLRKPAAPFFQSALDIIGCTAGQAVMIGDDIRGDVGGAQSAGISGLLVRTGKFQAADLKGDIEPAAVLDSIADLPEWWRTANHSLR